MARTAGRALLDVHSDADHHRSVFTLAGPDVEPAARALSAEAVRVLDLGAHAGVHPRIGVVDVVPWVNLTGWPLRNGPLAPAIEARTAFGSWAAVELGVPCFFYGPAGAGGRGRPPAEARSLPDVRREAWHELAPDMPVATGRAHPTAGAIAVGARAVLVAYNLWLSVPDIGLARRIARQLRSEHVRALGLRVGSQAQVSCNLLDPWIVGPGDVFDAVRSEAAIERAELVGLAPAAVVAAEPRARWSELGLDPSTTIEARLEEAGLDGGRSC